MTAAKAALAGLIALLAALGTALADDLLSAAEGVGAAGSGLAAFVAVYFLPNARSEDPETSTPGPGDAGQIDVLLAALLIFLVVVTLVVLGVV